MKFSDKLKKNKGEVAVNEAAQEGSEKKKHKPDPQKRLLQHGNGSDLYCDRSCDQYDRRCDPIQIFTA